MKILINMKKDLWRDYDIYRITYIYSKSTQILRIIKTNRRTYYQAIMG